MIRAERVLVGAVGLHLGVSVLHGVVHEVVPVTIPSWQLLFVVIALFGLPVLGVGLLSRGRKRTGATLILVSAVAGFGFEVVAHFAVVNPDHVSQVSHAAFTPTALGSTVGTGLAAIGAGWYLWRQAQGGSARSDTASIT